MMRQSRRVLVADQSATKRQDWIQLLQQLGMPVELSEVGTFEDCLDKLKKAQKQPYDLALFGVFDGVDQKDIPSRLAETDENQTIILVADAPRADLFDRALNSSIYDCLVAPVTLPDLKRLMKRASLPKDPLPTLIVDDTRVMRKVVMKVLNESQFALSISEADSCEMAVSLCRKIPYYCIFLDLNMPVQDGLETARQILKLQPDCRIVLMSTSKGDMDEKVEKNGLACFLPKPFYPKDINRLLHDFLGLEPTNLSNPAFLNSGTESPEPAPAPAKDETEYFLL